MYILEALSSDLHLGLMGDGRGMLLGPRRGLTSSSELFLREAERLRGLKSEGGCTSLSI